MGCLPCLCKQPKAACWLQHTSSNTCRHVFLILLYPIPFHSSPDHSTGDRSYTSYTYQYLVCCMQEVINVSPVSQSKHQAKTGVKLEGQGPVCFQPCVNKSLQHGIGHTSSVTFVSQGEHRTIMSPPNMKHVLVGNRLSPDLSLWSFVLFLFLFFFLPRVQRESCRQPRGRQGMDGIHGDGC